MAERLTYRVAEAAELLGLPLSTLHDLIGRHAIDAIKVRKPGAKRALVLIEASAIQRFLDAHRESA